MTGAFPFPLGGLAPREVPLSHSPLVRVIAQARFGSVLKIDSKDGVVPFQEAVRSEYPLLEQAAVQQLQVDFSSGAPNFRPMTGNLWRFCDATKDWILSLSSEAVTLETRRYTVRGNFLERWHQALTHVESIFAPVLTLRLGVRYLNRIQGESLVALSDWVKPNLVGIAEPKLREHIVQAMSEATLKVEEGVMLLRWGVMPPSVTYDPSNLEPVQSESWILDIDVASAEQKSFSATDLTTESQALAERAYTVFRYAITDPGLEHFGATP
jgi:uncharacterized protein (TIGR04255 family)